MFLLQSTKERHIVWPVCMYIILYSKLFWTTFILNCVRQTSFSALFNCSKERQDSILFYSTQMCHAITFFLFFAMRPCIQQKAILKVNSFLHYLMFHRKRVKSNNSAIYHSLLIQLLKHPLIVVKTVFSLAKFGKLLGQLLYSRYT